jgi:hypothetical protein
MAEQQCGQQHGRLGNTIHLSAATTAQTTLPDTEAFMAHPPRVGMDTHGHDGTMERENVVTLPGDDEPPCLHAFFVAAAASGFLWAATVTVAIGFLVIIWSYPVYASGTLSILYGTELSQRFTEQLQSTKVQRDLDLSKARVAQMETAAILYRTQADLASAQLAQLKADAALSATKTELTRAQMERTKAEIGGCSAPGQFNMLESVTRVKRTPKLAEVQTTPRTNRNAQLTLLTQGMGRWTV